MNDAENSDGGLNKSNNQLQMLQSGQGNNEVQVINSNTGMQSVSHLSSPRSMIATGRGRGNLMHGGGTFSHMQNNVPPGGMNVPGQHPYPGMPGALPGKPMGNMSHAGGNVPIGSMQVMGRGGNAMAQRGKFGKKGKTRNIPVQGGSVGKGKGIPGVPGGGNNQTGMLSSQGGKPSMGMFAQGGNSVPQNAPGNSSISGNMIGPGQQWGSSNMMANMQGTVSGNAPFGASSNAGTTVSGNYGATGVGGQPSQPPPHYNAAVAQQQMIQNAGGGNSSHMAQGTRFSNMNTTASHPTGAGLPGHSGKQALQNMLRARGPQFMNTTGNTQSVSGNTPGNQAQFVPPRQNFQGGPSQASSNSIQGATSGTSNRFGSIGGSSSNIGASTGMNSRMQNQFSNQNLGMGQNSNSQFNSGSYGTSAQVSSTNSSNSMSNMNSYMMRGTQPGSYGTNNPVMMNRQNVMGGNMPGGPGQGGNFMPRMGQSNYMQSPNVNMGNVMQGGTYRNIASGMQSQGNSGNINQSNMERMRMQNPHLLAQLQRSPANAPPNSQNQQHNNPFQQNRY